MPTDESKRSERQRCWEGRDAYFNCLNALNVTEPGKEPKNACSKEKRSYESNCAKSWVDYFNKRRIMAEEQKEVLAEVEKQRLAAEAKGYRR